MNCQSCDAVHINGILCHEHNCPDAWRDTVRSCKWCGREFIPEAPWRECCSGSCAASCSDFPKLVEDCIVESLKIERYGPNRWALYGGRPIGDTFLGFYLSKANAEAAAARDYPDIPILEDETCRNSQKPSQSSEPAPTSSD